MAQVTDTSAIQRLVRGARVRIRTQWALEGATTATVFAAVVALVSIFAVRTKTIAPASGITLLVLAGALIVVGAIVSAARRLDDEIIARRIDRASNLSDRLSTAIAFERVMRGGAPHGQTTRTTDSLRDPEQTTDELMQAAIRDGVRAVPRADLRKATPLTAPRDWKYALGFLAVSAIAAGLAIPQPDSTPRVLGVNPEKARPGTDIVIDGENLVPPEVVR